MSRAALLRRACFCLLREYVCWAEGHYPLVAPRRMIRPDPIKQILADTLQQPNGESALIVLSPEEKRMRLIRIAILGLALCATAVSARAAELCALFDELTTLQTAAVQQLLM